MDNDSITILPAYLTMYDFNKDSDEEDTEAHQKAKALRLRQAKSQEVLGQILHHLIFFFLLLFLCYSVLDANHVLWNNHIKSVYTGGKFNNVTKNLYMWKWLRNQVSFSAKM